MQEDPSIMYSCHKTQVHQIQIVCTDSLSLHIANNSAQQWNATARCLINCIWQGFIFPSKSVVLNHHEEVVGWCFTLDKFFPLTCTLQSLPLVACLSVPWTRWSWGISLLCREVCDILTDTMFHTLCSISLTVLGHIDSRTTQRLRLPSASQSKVALFIFLLARGSAELFMSCARREMFIALKLHCHRKTDAMCNTQLKCTKNVNKGKS